MSFFAQLKGFSVFVSMQLEKLDSHLGELDFTYLKPYFIRLLGNPLKKNPKFRDVFPFVPFLGFPETVAGPETIVLWKL